MLADALDGDLDDRIKQTKFILDYPRDEDLQRFPGQPLWKTARKAQNLSQAPKNEVGSFFMKTVRVGLAIKETGGFSVDADQAFEAT